MITNISILDTIQASGADAVNSNGNLIVSGLPNALRLTVDNSTYKKTLYTAGQQEHGLRHFLREQQVM